jgi:hypothetical protein
MTQEWCACHHRQLVSCFINLCRIMRHRMKCVKTHKGIPWQEGLQIQTDAPALLYDLSSDRSFSER